MSELWATMIHFTVTAGTYMDAIERAIMIARKFYGNDDVQVEMLSGTPTMVAMDGIPSLWRCEFRA